LQVEVFKIKAVYLGKLNQVLVGFKSLKKGQQFFQLMDGNDSVDYQI